MKNNDNDNADVGAVDVYTVASKKDDLLTDSVSVKKFMMLKLLKIMPELEYKILHGRIKDKDSEKIRLEYFKQYVNTCNTINTIIKDTTIGAVDMNLLKKYLDSDIVDDFIVENPE